MNNRGHIATAGIALIEVDRIANNKEDFKIDEYINIFVESFNLLPTFSVGDLNSNFLILYNLILITSLILLGTSFPDTDTWWRKKLGLWVKRGDKYQFAKFHRQLTHSLTLHTMILRSLIFLLIKDMKFRDFSLNFVYYLYYFEIGVFIHLFADVFVGSGGVPTGFTGHWRDKKRRLSIKLRENGKFMDKFTTYLYLVLLISYIFIYPTNYYTLLPIVVMTLIGFCYKSSYKIFWTFFVILLVNYFLFKIILNFFVN